MDYLLKGMILFFSSLLAVIYGITRIFTKTTGLYYRVPVLGFGCLCIGYLFFVVMKITGHSTANYYSLGDYGIIGAYLFFLSQNFDQMSSVMNEPGKYQKRNNLLGLLGPVGITVIFLVAVYVHKNIFVGVPEGYSKVYNRIFVVYYLLPCYVSYYPFRMAVSHDPYGSSGLIGCLRPYNISLTVMLALLSVEPLIVWYSPKTMGGEVLMVMFHLILSINMIITLPLLERGRLRFLTL